ncbi:alpha/beta fold hydrolase [Frankia sp. AgKG'84/4]|uniref:alpha/beta fold hydrolase n=1 Tax=Frankia sp. AgKG'84/4 TaxID=573490 RepID=UPI00200C92DF|nr:alpha/beta hydrolase [Frankia sp. AgKG'84/4]MCL9794502.1 alpha/beta hydrolase [Frankia sp. AgKG'84/4]
MRDVRVGEADGRPGVVLVHGLWNGAWTWDDVRGGLAGRGVDSVAVELPLTELAADVRATRDALTAFGRPAVLVGHSYGGAVITAAGAHPLVRHLLYVAAFQLDAGESVSRLLPGHDFPATRLPEAMRVSEDAVDLDRELGPHLLYSDAEAPVAAAAAARLRPVGRLLFRGVPEHIAWHQHASTYVICADDQVVHPDLQRAMARRATHCLVWPGGHSPALTRPDALADLIAGVVRGLPPGQRAAG